MLCGAFNTTVVVLVFPCFLAQGGKTHLARVALRILTGALSTAHVAPRASQIKE